ncbi:MAG: NUDIX domain-containing protein [Anaerolineae bacterium]|nr:NUDIX domain-containing protein [Anaerolineae bacterium]
MEYQPQPPRGRPVASDPYFTLMADERGIGFVHCSDAVLVVPLSGEGQVLLMSEYSPAFGGEVLVLPGGEIEAGEALAETANRELQEELGWRAGRLDFMGELRPFKYLAARQFVFLARDLSPSRLPGDERHPITVRPVALDRFTDLCANGELYDASAIAALFLVQRYVAA